MNYSFGASCYIFLLITALLIVLTVLVNVT